MLADQMDMTLRWAVERLDRLAEWGPEPDGWQLRKTDGVYQLWGRLVELPHID
jgi:hypothetical protein